MKKDLAIELTSIDLEMDTYSFYVAHEKQLHEAFNWVESTRRSYKEYVRQLAPFLKNHSLWESSVETFATAIELLNDSREKKYAEGTLNTIRSVIKDICYFAETYSKGRYHNALWGTSWNGTRGSNGTVRKRETTQERISRKLKTPKSLTMLEEIKLLEIVNEAYYYNSFAMGLAIMFYMGLRPGECAGLKYGDIRPLQGHPEVNCMYIHFQIRTTREMTSSLKTENAYRMLPIPEELNKMLMERRKNVEKRVEDVFDCPIVARDDAAGITEHCNPNSFATYCKTVLRAIHVSEEVIIGAAKEAKSEGRAEAEATSYLLRRNFATALLAVCGLKADEIKYLVGHAIETMYEKRSDYLNPDVLYRLWKKENLRSFNSKPTIEFTVKANALSVHQKIACVTVPGAYLMEHPDGTILHVHNTDVNDRIKIIVQEGSYKSVCMLSSNQLVPRHGIERVNIKAEYADALNKARNRSKGKTEN